MKQLILSILLVCSCMLMFAQYPVVLTQREQATVVDELLEIIVVPKPQATNR